LVPDSRLFSSPLPSQPKQTQSLWPPRQVRGGHEFGRAAMQIRTLTWRELPVWPPEWWVTDQEGGEAGVLEDVQLRNDLTPSLISIFANYLGHSRKGIIVLEDSLHLEVLYRRLKENLGRPLTEIGDLEIDLLPPLQKRGPRQSRPEDKSKMKTRIAK
jgi:hypothetical protein